jgi:hypothetical protein
MSTATLAASELELNVATLSESPESDEGLFEVVNGQRVEIPPMSLLATRIATRLGTRLSPFVEAQHLGEIFVEGLIQRAPGTRPAIDCGMIRCIRSPRG